MKLKLYPEYKDSGVEWIGEIPQNWEMRRLKYNCSVNPPGKKSLSDPKTKVNFLPMEKVSEEGDYDLESKTEYENVSSGYTYFEDNDVLLAKITPCFENGKGAFVENLKYGFGFGTTEFHILRYGAEMYPKYLFFLTKSHLFRVIGEAFMEGAAGQKRVSTDFVKNFPMPTPSMAEQKLIVNYLGKKTSEIDLTIEKDTRLIELLKEKRTALINHVVTKGLDPTVKMKDSGVEWIGEIPEECEITRLKFFTSLFGGYAFKSNDFSDSGIQLIRIGNLYKNRLALERKPVYLPKDYSEIYPQYLLRKGDIIISMTGTVNKEDYGYTVQIGSTKPFLMNQRVGKFRVDETKINKKYFKYVLESRIFLDSLYSIPSGTKQANLSPENILNIKIYVFHLSKQQEIVDYLDEKTHQIDKTIQKIQENIELLEEYKKSLIHHVVTGKVDVREVAV